MTPLQRDRWVKKHNTVLTELVRTLSVALGGRSEQVTSRMVTHTISTDVGDMTMTVVADWVACRFLDHNLAASFFGPEFRTCSKWNHGCGERFTAHDMFAEFCRQLSRVRPDALGLTYPLIAMQEFGTPYGGTPHTRPGYDPIYLYRGKRNVCRWYRADGVQIGPEQRNVAPAVAWALANGYSDDHSALAMARAREQV